MKAKQNKFGTESRAQFTAGECVACLFLFVQMQIFVVWDCLATIVAVVCVPDACACNEAYVNNNICWMM